MNIEKHPASFRDPAGQVVRCNDQIVRFVYQNYQTEYEKLMSSGLYSRLIDERLLVPHEEIDIPEDSAANHNDIYKVIKPQYIPFISYPYEWSYSALRQAALLTLRIQKIALEFGMILRDASAFNVQFLGTRPIFIDTLSFGQYEEGEYWQAYRQFCQHFLNPLALMSRCDIRLGQMSRIYLDGIPTDLTASLLPWKERLSFKLFAHIYLHRYAQDKYQEKEEGKWRKRVLSRKEMEGLLESLERTILDLKWQPQKSEWLDYYQATNYTADAMEQKACIVKEWVQSCKPKMAWDLGANEGNFSRIAAENGASVIAFDIDHGVVERHFCNLQKNNNEQILPLIQDLANPSPGLGWIGQERDSLFKRGPVDLILALALIHHLVITNNLQFIQVAEFFAKTCSDLIIEFVSLEDSQVQKMLNARKDVRFEYNEEIFRQAFKQFFIILEEKRIAGTMRTMFLMKARG